MAQGAALAIEDAIALAGSLASDPDGLPTAFLRYEAVRRPRAARVQRLSRRFGWLYHLGGPMRLARNVMLGLRREERALEGFDWLYGGGSSRSLG
jgi:salicylate hydroxylase